MSDTLNAAAKALQSKLDASGFDGSVRFEIEGEGALRVADGSVSIDDGEADCTIAATMETLQDLFAGDLDPTAAFMTGRIRIDGDMSVAMKLSQLLA